MNEQLVLFEGNEVKVKTDEGNTLINLVHTAKCCGLTKNKSNGTIIVNWKSGSASVCSKLKSLSSGGSNNPPQYVEEIQYILDEIENTDDRNGIYMSSWLSKRLAMECKSEKAMQYKNFLANLDEKREKGQLQVSNQEVAQLISSTVQGMFPTIMTEMVKNFAPLIVDAKNEIKNVVGLMHDQSVIHEQERDELKQLIGFHSVNTTKMVNTIKDSLSDKLGCNVTASNPIFLKVKKAIFKEFGVFKWEDIRLDKYNNVYAFIEEYINELKAS